jgi:hypothetical protein
MSKTRRWAVAAFAVVSSACFGSGANAGAIPYPDAGTPIAIPSYNFTASSTGNITAYFYTSDAADDEQVSMRVNGAPTDIFGLDNHTSAVGEAFNLGAVNAGDKIEFFISDFSTGVIGTAMPRITRTATTTHMRRRLPGVFLGSLSALM